jgi:hypothetical protein
VLENITGSITAGGTPTLATLVICTLCAIGFGLAIAAAYMYKNRYSKSLAMALVLIPATVQVIIMLVNGNIGVGVAVAGAFSLVRFRSLPGNAKDIGSLFFAMAIGFVTGLGYLFYAVCFLVLIGGAALILARTRFGQEEADVRSLRITIPENLDYEGLFEDVFARYTSGTDLDRVKTTNMGSLYELTYAVRLKKGVSHKAFMDEIRCRNGNLNILLSREIKIREEL